MKSKTINEDIELKNLEDELERQLASHNKPIQSQSWVPYKEFMKKLKVKANIDDSKVIRELERDLIKAQKQEHKNLLKEVKKLYKQIGLKSMYKKLQKANLEVKNSEIHRHNVKTKQNIVAYYENKYTLKLIEKTSYKMKNKLGELFNYEPSVNIEVNSQTANVIASTLYHEFMKLQSRFKHHYNQGFETVLKLSFLCSDLIVKETLFSLTIRGTNLTIDKIRKSIIKNVVERFIGGDSNFDALFRYATFFIFPLSKTGGCGACKKVVEKIRYKDRTVKLVSPKSSNDNCLFMCFVYFLQLKGNTLNFGNIRKELGLGEGKIKFEDVTKVANHFDVGYILLNQKQEIISYKDLQNKPSVHIMLMNEHYYIVENIDYFRCDHCGRRLLSSNENHECSNKMTTFYKSRVCKKREFVDMIDCSDKSKITKDSMIFFDLETFQETSYHVPYACGFSYDDHENVKISYGKNCMDDFINHITKVENKTICAYNGSGFDFYILINYLKEKNIEIKNLILSNGSVLSFKFGKEGKENKVFDLYRFIMTNLDSACGAYKIKNHKLKFDVLKIQSWDLAEKHRQEVEPYLKYDVLSLSELFFTFNDSIFENDNVNITKYVTLSNMAYSLWQKTLTELVEIPNMEKYDFIKKGTYGARCYPSQKEFKSKHYEDVVNKQMNYDELLKTNEYLFPADATSLYPAAMCGFELIDVKYPIGPSVWSDNPKQEYDENKCGLYEVEFTCPNIVVPILPRKTLNGGLEWSLLEGTGIYTNVEINNAFKAGYTIKFINKCLIWNKSGNVFKTYVDKYYQMKIDAEKEENEVKRSIAKLLLNAMYGKTLQRAIFHNTNIINNYNELLTFFKDYEITDIAVLSDSKLLMSGTSLKKETQITKPCQLGAFVLSYSREIMLNYMKAIDPTLQTHIFTYTDTDSLHMYGKYHKKLTDLGMIKDKNDASLGYLCSDIKNDGVMISETCLAPKTYCYEYIDNKNDVYDLNKGVKKGKGIPKKCLNYNMYTKYKEEEQKATFSGLKRKHKNLTRADVKNGVPLFSIVNNTQTRTFMKTDWKGMDLVNNKYYPKGYKF